MTRRSLFAAVAWGLALISMGMVLADLVASGTHGALGRVYGPSMALAVAMAIVGGLIAARRPGHVIGWLLLFIGFTQALVGLCRWVCPPGLPVRRSASASRGRSVARHLDVDARARRGADAALGAVSHRPPAVARMALAPDRELKRPRRRDRHRRRSGVADSRTGTARCDRAAERGSGAALVLSPTILVVGSCAVAALVSLVVRYRRANADERHQLRWFVFGSAVLLVGALSDFFKFTPGSAVAIAWTTIAVVGAVTLPTAIGIAILRYHLYDIDIIINRALVYGALAALITGVYVGIAVGIGSLIGSGGKPNLGLSILPTAIVAVGFQPVRERLQKVADRVMDRQASHALRGALKVLGEHCQLLRQRQRVATHGPRPR